MDIGYFNNVVVKLCKAYSSILNISFLLQERIYHHYDEDEANHDGHLWKRKLSRHGTLLYHRENLEFNPEFRFIDAPFGNRPFTFWYKSLFQILLVDIRQWREKPRL